MGGTDCMDLDLFKWASFVQIWMCLDAIASSFLNNSSLSHFTLLFLLFFFYSLGLSLFDLPHFSFFSFFFFSFLGLSLFDLPHPPFFFYTLRAINKMKVIFF